MSFQPIPTQLPHDQEEIAEALMRNFLITLVIAFIGELLLRIFPTFLAGVEERKWLEWLLVSLIGVCAYLVWNIAIWYKEPRAKFKEFRPWYRATAARGPILALVILIALTHINFQVQLPSAAETQAGQETEVQAPAAESGEAAGQPESEAAEAPEEAAPEAAPNSTFDFGINFSEASEPVLLVVAFLLGFYSRLAKEVLEAIARFIFRDIFDKAFPELNKDKRNAHINEIEEQEEEAEDEEEETPAAGAAEDNPPKKKNSSDGNNKRWW